ncbi:MAG: PRC and DUF2382 domain-containing protein [Acidobacteriota bacterium]
MAILPYTQQDDYNVAQDGQNCIGWTVTDQTGNDIGKVTEMFINTDTETVDSIIVNGNVRVPARDIALKDNQVVMRGVFQQNEEQPPHAAVEQQTSGAVGLSAAANSQNYDGSENETSSQEHIEEVSRAVNDNEAHRAANDNEVVLPVIEEQLSVGKRTVERGSARVSTRVEEVPVEESVTLREEHVTVERRPVERTVENAPAAFQEGTIEITEMAEVPVVTKEIRVVEEVVIEKSITEREHIISDTVKKTEVDIDRTNRNDAINRDRN